MELKKTTKTVHTVDYNDWNEFVNKTYGFEPRNDRYLGHQYPYDFVAAEEASNYADYGFSAGSQNDIDWYSDYNRKELAEWIADPWNKVVGTPTIFNDLFERGLIPAGNYSISVFW